MKKEKEKDEEDKKTSEVTESKKEKEDESIDSKEDIKTEDIKKEVDATFLNILRKRQQIYFFSKRCNQCSARVTFTFELS